MTILPQDSRGWWPSPAIFALIAAGMISFPEHPASYFVGFILFSACLFHYGRAAWGAKASGSGRQPNRAELLLAYVSGAGSVVAAVLFALSL